MDDRSFDRLARALGEASDRRTGLKALVGGMFGVGGLAALDAETDAKRKDQEKDKDRDRRRDDGPDAVRRKKKRKKKCAPPCGAGFACVKGACTCASGIACGAACCAAGQSCRDGACVDAPDPATCIAAGEPCKNRGRRCCDGRVCSSGQGGDQDIACYAPKTGACTRTADCVYGMSCQGGQCLPPVPGTLAAPCDATSQQLCATPGAVCTDYTGAGSPSGTFCTLPLRKVCTGNPQCTCYKCWYVNDGGLQAEGRQGHGRASTNTMACCHPQGQACHVDQDCCLGLECVDGTCGGTICVPDDAEGCDASTPCCTPTALCRSGVCQLGLATGEVCSTAPGSLPCLETGTACTTQDGGDTTTRCLKSAGLACSSSAVCRSGQCTGGVCAALTEEQCGTSNNAAVCKAASTDACVDGGGGVTKCLRAAGVACASGGQCASGTCGTNSKCAALTAQACGTSASSAQCASSDDSCVDTGSGAYKCRGAAGKGCTADDQCISASCGSSPAVCKALDGDKCGDSANGAVCVTATSPAPQATCGAYATNSGGADGTFCLLANTAACTGAAECASNYCHTDNTCKAAIGTGLVCTSSDICKNSDAVCTTYTPTTGVPTDTRCLLQDTETCSATEDCQSYLCSGSPTKKCQPCFTPFETKVSYTAKFPVKANTSSADNPLTSVSGVAIYPGASVAYVSSFSSQRMAKVDLTSYAVTVGTAEFGGCAANSDGCDLTGVGVTSDGKVIVAAWGTGRGASMIYEVDTSTLNKKQDWYRMPESIANTANTYYRRPNSIFYEGSSTSGTAWVGLWRGYNGDSNYDGATSKSDLLKFTIASSSDWDNSAKTPAATYQNVCGSFSNNAPANIRQIAPSGRTNDGDHLYIGCDNSKVIVFSKTSGTVVNTIPVPGDPRGVTFIGDTMYVSALSSNVIYPFVLSGTGATLTYQPRCALKYVSTTPYPSEMARNTNASTGKVWLGATTGGVMTVTDFVVCTGSQTVNSSGVCA